MNSQAKRVRIAAAAILAALSVVGVAEASAAPSATMADRHWCC